MVGGVDGPATAFLATKVAADAGPVTSRPGAALAAVGMTTAPTAHNDAAVATVAAPSRRSTGYHRADSVDPDTTKTPLSQP